MKKTPTTDSVNAPQPSPQPMAHYMPPAPRQYRLERQGDLNEPIVARFPRVIGGICEFCGVLDKNVPSEFQYKLCPHYRGITELRCSYCPSSKDTNEVVYHSKLNVYQSPTNHDELIAVCNSYECSRKHQARFRK